jgi:hypothetical protein
MGYYDMGRTVCVYRLRYREERRRKTRDVYESEVCLTISPAYGQLESGQYIYATSLFKVEIIVKLDCTI